MPDSIPGSTKILIYFGNSIIFVYFSWRPLSVNLLCQECTFYCVPRKKRYTLLPTHAAAQSSKRFKPLSVTILLWQGHCWTRKKTTKEDKLFMLVFWPSSTLKFLFVFDFKCLNNPFLKGSLTNNFCHA